MSSQAAGLKWELSRLAFFSGLPEAELDALARAAQPKIFRAREMLFHEGDPGGSMLVILSGRVKVSGFSAGGKECVLSFMGPGEVLGEITLLDGGTRTASACALEDTRVATIARRDVLPLLERNPAAALHIIELLCERLRNTSQLVEDAAFLAAGPRLARALLRLLDAHGVEEGRGWRLELKLSQGALGAHVGLMRESVNRQLRVWEEDGVVDAGEAGLVVLKRDALERIAELT